MGGAGGRRPATLRRTLGLWPVALSGVGVILGAGVYALIAPAAREAGNALWAAFLLAALTAGLTAYAYARLAAVRSKNSPEFQCTSRAFGPGAGFIAGWLMIAASLLAAATVALGFGGYVRHLVGTSTVLNALLLLIGVGAVVCAGIGRSVRFAIVLTGIEAAGLAFVIVIGVPGWPEIDYLEMPRGWAGLSTAAGLMFFSYLGFEQIANFAEEMRRPERDLPRAMGLAIAGSTAIYALVAVSVVAAVDWRALAASEAPLALVARTALGPRADLLLSLIALAATANTVLLVIVSVSRSIHGMAAAGVLPIGLARVGRNGTPRPATALVLGIAALLVLPGDLAQVAAMTDASMLVSFLLVNLSLPVLAGRRLLGDRTGRRATDFVVPALALLLCGWLLAHVGWVGVTAALGLVAVGLLARLAVGRFAPSAPLRSSPGAELPAGGDPR